ncbi:MAG: alpha/beta hydrolase [Acetatifactor sp.]|nr:alpha/beta hydrolase [Acetatifactor sp.]
MKKKIPAVVMAALMIGQLSACGAPATDNANTEGTLEDETDSPGSTVTNLEKIDMSKWMYHADDNVYYQIGISYCETPADASYEKLAVFVPGDYFSGTDNGDGTYTCEVNSNAKVNGFTAQTAPIVMPIDTPGYSAQAALTGYTSLPEYMEAGFVYVHAGCRGRDAGAPAGVTDIKAAIRYLRYIDDITPGDAEKIFVFGMSGGGAQSAVVGAAGDSGLYTPYLEQIGAVQGVSDAVYGSMDWCPITNLDSADEAYEWMMGVTRSGLSDDEQAISDALAAAFADYINQVGIKDENGNVLILEESTEGIYQAGSYYDYILGVIEESLNNFLSDTEFPYDSSAGGGKDMGPGGMGGFGGRGGDGDFGGFGMPEGEGDFGGFGMPGGKEDGGRGTREMDGKGGFDGQAENGGFGGRDNAEGSFEELDDITRIETLNGITISGIYETAGDYIDALNANGIWVTYDAETNTASITSVSDFVKAFKGVSKNLGAFDQLNAGQGENVLFGYGDGNGAHFDAMLADILKELESSYASDFEEDLQKKDAVGYTAAQRLNMYTPLYYLLESEDGYGTSTPAKYWRIRSGIAQSDTSLTTEVNLALALQNYDGVESVDFAAVWGQQHVKAERTGDSTANFITWVNECMK